MRLRELNLGCFGGGTGLPSLLGGLKSNPWLRVKRTWLLGIAAVTILTVNSAAVEEVASFYYTSGDPAKDYDKKLVRGFGSSAEDLKVYLVQAGKRHLTQATPAADGVLQLPAEELSAIPEGPPAEPGPEKK